MLHIDDALVRRNSVFACWMVWTMLRNYEYQGYTFEVSVESDVMIGAVRHAPERAGYVAVVTISWRGQVVSVFSPLRFGEGGGRPFASDVDALMGGYSAARKIVDDFFLHA
ncbi:conserved hypothetical protein [Paraburkholderia tropica]|uniref:hypothetical protein n=1 Tax=Paraburkholderia tropica TaxID=92647 RepID=UPI001CAD8E28|nr:hypothetical protein [Paraburkholderia tropica]CAG9227386.1 conserved hypothetical protein [Paraburkholderia tropica]